jgi:hypothetical protein
MEHTNKLIGQNAELFIVKIVLNLVAFLGSEKVNRRMNVI